LPRWLGLACIATAAFLGCAAVGFGIQIREPDKHDEFSYLLAADTFLRGRLANPTPPAWQHFETFHVLLEPSYASKYPPAQGAALALGRWLSGHAIVGVWLSSAFACAAIAWLLLAWLPRPWAWAGAWLALVSFSIAGWWSQTYWGGSLAAGAGALVYGALRRLVEAPRARDGAWLGVGLALLAVSRPFEGAVASLPPALVLAACLVRRAPAARLVLARALAPTAAAVALALAFLGYYDHRVTGHALRPPYVEHSEQYLMVPLFSFGSPVEPPAWRHAVLAELHHDFDLSWYAKQRTAGERLAHAVWKAQPSYQFYLGPPGLLALLGLALVRWDRWLGLALASCALVLFATLFVSTFGGRPHYLAPVAGLIVLLLGEGLRRWSQVRPTGLAIGWVVVAVVVAMVTLRLAVRLERHAQPDAFWSRQRASLVRDLERRPGRDLVLVRYGPGHNVHEEWVYNGADLASQEVLFARSMDAAADHALLDAYPGRQVWCLDVGSGGARITPGPVAPAGGRAAACAP